MDPLLAATPPSVDYSTSLLILVPTLAITFLSVPVVTLALTAIVRRLSPTARLTATLKRDLEIYKDLPESAEKVIFEQHINRVLGSLNKQVVPRSLGISYLLLSLIMTITMLLWVRIVIGLSQTQQDQVMKLVLNPTTMGFYAISAVLVVVAIIGAVFMFRHRDIESKEENPDPEDFASKDLK